MTRIPRLAAGAAVLVGLAVLFAGATATAQSKQAPPVRPELHLPAPTGTRPIGTTILHLVDRARRDLLAPTRTNRQLIVHLWYPAATRSGRPAPYLSPRLASLLEKTFELPAGTFGSFRTHGRLAAPIARGRHPLLLFSHGLGTLPEFHTALMGDLASRGYVVAAIAHTYDAAAVELPNGRVILGTAPAQPNERQRRLLLGTRAGDLRFVLDELLKRSRRGTGLLAGKLAPDKVGALGHSLGGATAAAAMLIDPRIRAGADLDGTIFGDVAGRGLRTPFMLMIADRFEGRLTPDQAAFFNRLRSTRYALAVRGAGHYSFTDLPLFASALPGLDQTFDIGTIDPLRADAAIRTYVAAFFDRTLRNREAPLLHGPSAAFPEIAFAAAGSARMQFAPQRDAVPADVAPVGSLPRARVTTVTTERGSLVAVALPRPAASTGLVWRLARRLDASIVSQVSEADVGPKSMLVSRSDTGTPANRWVIALN
jgi:predicted dienelactone hydrolase